MASEMSAFVNEVESEFPLNADKAKAELPFIFVAPLGSSVPEDGIFQFTTIDDLRDLKGLGQNAVVLFHEDQIDMLRTLCQNQSSFGLDVRSLYGVNELDYRGWFDDASFGAERQMYGPMVSEFRVAQELQQIEEARTQSGTAVERARYERADGSIRHLELANPDTGSDDELE